VNPLRDASEESSSGEQRWTMAFLSLARELWVTRDRQRALEVLLTSGGIIDTGAVDRLQPTPAEQADIDRRCQAFLDNLLQSLRRDHPA
jgi:hypothetical protein